MSNLTGKKLLELLYQEATAIKNPGSLQRVARYKILKHQWSALRRSYPVGDAARDGLRGKWEVTEITMELLEGEFE